jgi:hypothetical protein
LSVIERKDIEHVAVVLRERHGCHTAMLYGSYARGDATPESDLDVAGFAPVAKSTRIAGPWRGTWLDAFIHPDRMLTEPGPEMLSLRGGVVLFERDGAGAALLERLDALYARGPEPLAADEIAALRQWAWKMLERAARADAEGNFRRAWLLTALLEDYFRMRGLWYPGPKQALAYLRIHEPALSSLFEAALVPGATLAVVEAAVTAAVGPHDDLGEISL